QTALLDGRKQIRVLGRMPQLADDLAIVVGAPTFFGQAYRFGQPEATDGVGRRGGVGNGHVAGMGETNRQVYCIAGGSTVAAGAARRFWGTHAKLLITCRKI